MHQPTEQRSPEADNPVASFEVGIITKKGSKVGVCIKFSMYDGSTKLTHWSLQAFAALQAALEGYVKGLGQGALMHQVQLNPSLEAGFGPRHPYNTLLTEKPEISEDEIGRATFKTGIDKAVFASKGLVFEIRPMYHDGGTDTIPMHEYTTSQLWGYLISYMESAARLMGRARGNA